MWECNLYEYDPASRMLTAAAVWSREPTPEDEAWVGTRVSLDERPGYIPIIEGGQTVVTRAGDAGLDPADRAAMEEWGELETLAVPLRFRDRGVVGCLLLIEKREGRSFGEEDVELVELLAGPAAVAVRNARLFRLQQEQNRYLSSLLDTGRAITTSITLEDSLARICRTAAGGAARPRSASSTSTTPRATPSSAARSSARARSRPCSTTPACTRLTDYPSDRRVLEERRVVQETLADEDLPCGRTRFNGALGGEGLSQRAARRRRRADGHPRADRDGARADLRRRRSGARACAGRAGGDRHPARAPVPARRAAEPAARRAARDQPRAGLFAGRGRGARRGPA